MLKGWWGFGASSWSSAVGLAVGLLGLPGILAWRHATAGSRAELTLRCRVPYQVKAPMGELLLTRSSAFDMAPGEVAVEIWRPARACWTRRTLTLLPGTKAVLDLDELAALDRCDGDGPRPRSPAPSDLGHPSRHR